MAIIYVWVVFDSAASLAQSSAQTDDSKKALFGYNKTTTAGGIVLSKRFASYCRSLTVEGGASIISGVYSNAIVESSLSCCGGLIGFLRQNSNYTEISQCYFDGKVIEGGKYCGGIVGNTNNNIIDISDCANTGTVIAEDEAGGIIGRNGVKARGGTRGGMTG